MYLWPSGMTLFQNLTVANSQIICIMDQLQLFYILLYFNRHPWNIFKKCTLQPHTTKSQSLQVFFEE